MAPLYLKVTEGVEQFAVTLLASVTGEAAEVTILDPSGEVVVNEIEDYDSPRTIEIDVPEGADDATWELRITDPQEEGLHLDDVQFHLEGRIPPFLSPAPEHLDVFAADARYKPDEIDATVEISERVSLDAGASATLTWQMTALPENKTYALRITATDVDYPRELTASINGGEPFAVPMTGNAITDTFKLLLPRETLEVGENTIELTQDPGGGSNVVAVDDAAILIGDRIREDRGY
jgi:hypothetical protein